MKLHTIVMGIVVAMSIFATSAIADGNLLLSGYVFEDDGYTPVANAFVQATVQYSETVSGYTDSYGYYELQFGNYSQYLEVFVQLFAQKGSLHNTLTDLIPCNYSVLDIDVEDHPQCSDLQDNDNDGKVDYPADPGCSSPNDDSELMMSSNSEGAGNPGSTGGLGIGVTMSTEDFVPLIWMSPNRRILHNNADGNSELIERIANYAFEGEQIIWEVIVMDKNGADKIADVYATISSLGQQPGDGDIEANCNREGLGNGQDITEYNARILEERITEFDVETMSHYVCTLTVEPYSDGLGMYGEYFIIIEARDIDDNLATYDENEYWFLNPLIGLEIVANNGIDFGEMRPGTNAYSDTIIVRNAAEEGSGVMLDMAMSGSDFYDPSSSGAKCPTTNVLSLSNLAYYATNGNYETGHYATANSPRAPFAGGDEGYFRIPYETGSETNREEIIEGDGLIYLNAKPYQGGNVLTPGGDIAITFRLSLPEPCNGDFSEGQIYFWGEAI